MGCRKITYYEGEDLAKNHFFSGVSSEKRATELFFGVDYYPYGKILREWRSNPESEKYLSTHHERDTETGLDYRGARYYDSDIARFLSLDPDAMKYNEWSDYNYVFSNPVMLVDATGKGPEIPVNLFGATDSPTFHNVSVSAKYGTNDGVFSIFGHSNSRGIQYYNSEGKAQAVTGIRGFNALMTERSSEWTNAIESGKEITLCLFSCNAASNSYIDHDGIQRDVDKTIAQKISEGHPNATVIAADGYVIYGTDSKGAPVILGVDNGEGTGGFVTIKNGKVVAKRQQSYDMETGKSSSKPKVEILDETEAVETTETSTNE